MQELYFSKQIRVATNCAKRKLAPCLPNGWDTRNQGVPIPLVEVSVMPAIYLNLAVVEFEYSIPSIITGRSMYLEIELR